MIDFNKFGYLEVYSKVLQESIYFVRDYSVRPPKKDLVRYKLTEALKFKGLSDEQIRYLHNAKILLKGEVVK